MKAPLVVLAALAAVPLALELGTRVGAAVGGGWSDERVAARLDELEALAGAPPGGADPAPRPGPPDDPQADPRAGAPGERRPAETALNPWAGFYRRGDRRRLQGELDRLASGQADAAFDVYVIGGCAATQLGGAPGAAVLADELAACGAAAGREVRLVAFGGVDWKQPQHVLWLEWLLSLGLQPDAVVLLDGPGELALEALNAARGLHPTYPAAPRWSKLTARLANDPELLDPVLEFRRRQRLLGRGVERARASRWMASAFLRNRALAGLAERERDLERAGSALEAAFAERADASLLRGPRADVGGTPADAVGRWIDGSRQMRALCDAFGARFAHVLQPALHDVDARPPLDEELAEASPAGGPRARSGRAYPLLRAGLRVLAAEGTTVVDASDAFRDAEGAMFAGDCRCTEAGARELARQVGEALAAVW